MLNEVETLMKKLNHNQNFNLKIMKKYILPLVIFAMVSCQNTSEYDASGTFEAEEVMVSAKANGDILELNLSEGQKVNANQQIGLIDSKATELQREQVQASIGAIEQKTNSAAPQISVLESQLNSQKAQIGVLNEQLQTAIRERNRVSNLVKSDAATQKQLDDASAQVQVLQKQVAAANTQVGNINAQISATKEQVNIQNRAILSEKKPTQTKIAQIDDQLKNNVIASPIDGTVLTKYVNQGEFATIGKPIFKVADLNEMSLRVYLTGDQLAKAKVGQQVKVFVDAGDGKTKELPGTISWISTTSEFTPKTIQTKNERANLVYAAKVNVKNDGFLKIGMYGEVKF